MRCANFSCRLAPHDFKRFHSSPRDRSRDGPAPVPIFPEPWSKAKTRWALPVLLGEVRLKHQALDACETTFSLLPVRPWRAAHRLLPTETVHSAAVQQSQRVQLAARCYTEQ